MAEFPLDESQNSVLRALAQHDAISVFGAPGTGKSFTLRAIVKNALSLNPAAQIAVLTTSRRSASATRNQLSLELGGLNKGVQVRSISAFAFEIVARYAQLSGRRPPELITGPDQDAILKEAFEIALSNLPSKLDLSLAQIPNLSPETVNLPAFRADFRDLITRAAELQLSPADLTALSRQHRIPVWELGAQLMETYEKMLASSAGIEHAHADQVDHARLAALAARDIQLWRADQEKDSHFLNSLQIPRWDLILVDDVQNAPLSLLELLRQLQASGAKIVTFGDPDSAVEGYRGGVAYLPMLLTRSRAAKGLGAVRLNLQISYRTCGDIALIAAQIQQAIHTAGGGSHRNVVCRLRKDADPEQNDSNVLARTFVNERAQIAFIANEFKRLHLEQGIGYGEMAVITRSASEHLRLRRLFEEFQISVEPAVSTLPLREAPLVHEILSLIASVIGFKSAQLAANVSEILGGRLFGYPPAVIRRITRELHGWELLAAGTRSGSELLESLTKNPDAEIYAKIPELVKIAAAASAIKKAESEQINVQEALWQIWDTLQIAQDLQEQALNGGELGTLADENLDSVMQLFRFAQRAAERENGAVSLQRLLSLLEVQDLPEDSIAKSGNNINQVALITAASAMGQNWKYAAVVNINDGSWPNTQLRNPLTQVPQLSSMVIHSLVAGENLPPRALLSEVIDDELRMFLVAVTRAANRLYLCAVESDAANASAFLKLVAAEVPKEMPAAAENKMDESAAAAKQKVGNTPKPFRVPLLHCTSEIKVINYQNELGKLRIVARYGSDSMRLQAKNMIAALLKSRSEQQGSRHLDTWVDELPISIDAEIPGKPTVSPSSAERYLECPLSAFYNQIGARADDGTSLSLEIGSLLHKIFELHPDGGVTEMITSLDSLWQNYFPALEEADFADIRTELLEMIQNYDHYAQQTAGLHKYTELSAKYIGAEFDVHARIDRLEANPDNPQEAAVVDFKTSKSYPTSSEVRVNPQLRIYQWLIDQGCLESADSGDKITRSSGASLFFLRKPLKRAFYRQEKLSAEQLQEVETDLMQVASDIKGPQFLAQAESKLCANRCAFKTLCPGYEGKRVFS
ncbi:PD-(D/E)XK nuclease family protein [Arcanobacterium hippocoleae]